MPATDSDASPLLNLRARTPRGRHASFRMVKVLWLVEDAGTAGAPRQRPPHVIISSRLGAPAKQQGTSEGRPLCTICVRARGGFDEPYNRVTGPQGFQLGSAFLVVGNNCGADFFAAIRCGCY